MKLSLTSHLVKVSNTILRSGLPSIELKKYTTQETYDGARTACGSLGGWVFAPDNAAEALVMNEIMGRPKVSYQPPFMLDHSDRYWIGMKNTQDERQTWRHDVDDRVATHIRFGGYEPNYVTVGGGQWCMARYLYDGSSDYGEWGDFWCHHPWWISNYICAFNRGVTCSCASDSAQLCNGHGDCYVEAGTKKCTCSPGWAGTDCTSCARGYGPADVCTQLNACTYHQAMNQFGGSPFLCSAVQQCIPGGTAPNNSSNTIASERTFDKIIQRVTPTRMSIGLRWYGAGRPFEQAKRHCYDEEGWIFAPTTEDENTHLEALIVEKRTQTGVADTDRWEVASILNQRTHYTWIGIERVGLDSVPRSDGSGSFLLVERQIGAGRQATSFLPWKDDEPTRGSRRSNIELCVRAKPPTSGSNKHWEDYRCSYGVGIREVYTCCERNEDYD